MALSIKGNKIAKDRLKLRNKLFRTEKEKSWRKRHVEKKRLREENLLQQLEKKEELCSKVDCALENSFTDNPISNQRRLYTLSIALPGSILNNAQSPELRMYLAGQIARAASISCVDEVVVFDDYARMTESEIENYYNGSWQAGKPIREDNSECNLQMARVLEYLECPQYLRKALFPLHKSLACAGVLNPLDCPHHLRATDLSIPYREGIVLDKPVKKGRGPLCDVGLNKVLQLESELDLPPSTRITVQLTNTDPEAKRFRGKVISAQRVRYRAGIYWGYNVRLALSLSDALTNKPPYDFIIGTSEKGKPIEELELPSNQQSRILVVFGGLKGLEAAVEADENLTATNPADVFEHYVSIATGQGSRTIRTEEAVLMTLGVLKSRLDFDYGL